MVETFSATLASSSACIRLSPRSAWISCTIRREMSAATSAARGTSAAETSDALSAADGFDLFIDGSYVVA
jgi:hypothetical protein